MVSLVQARTFIAMLTLHARTTELCTTIDLSYPHPIFIKVKVTPTHLQVEGKKQQGDRLSLHMTWLNFRKYYSLKRIQPWVTPKAGIPLSAIMVNTYLAF